MEVDFVSILNRTYQNGALGDISGRNEDKFEFTSRHPLEEIGEGRSKVEIPRQPQLDTPKSNTASYKNTDPTVKQYSTKYHQIIGKMTGGLINIHNLLYIILRDDTPCFCMWYKNMLHYSIHKSVVIV